MEKIPKISAVQSIIDQNEMLLQENLKLSRERAALLEVVYTVAASRNPRTFIYLHDRERLQTYADNTLKHLNL